MYSVVDTSAHSFAQPSRITIGCSRDGHSYRGGKMHHGGVSRMCASAGWNTMLCGTVQKLRCACGRTWSNSMLLSNAWFPSVALHGRVSCFGRCCLLGASTCVNKEQRDGVCSWRCTIICEPRGIGGRYFFSFGNRPSGMSVNEWGVQEWGAPTLDEPSPSSSLIRCRI